MESDGHQGKDLQTWAAKCRLIRLRSVTHVNLDIGKSTLSMIPRSRRNCDYARCLPSEVSSGPADPGRRATRRSSRATRAPRRWIVGLQPSPTNFTAQPKAGALHRVSIRNGKHSCQVALGPRGAFRQGQRERKTRVRYHTTYDGAWFSCPDLPCFGPRKKTGRGSPYHHAGDPKFAAATQAQGRLQRRHSAELAIRRSASRPADSPAGLAPIWSWVAFQSACPQGLIRLRRSHLRTSNRLR
jgi:hypothetical protein